MSSTQLIEQCATRLRGIVEALDNIHDNTPHRWSTDLDEVHSSAESLLAMIKDQAPARSETSFEEWLANELEGEDGQPVPAAVCDIALARRAFNHWPKLEQPAKVGGVRFSAGVSSRLVVEAAQRLYEFESTPEKEAERIERLQAFREQLDPLNLAPHAEAFNEAPAEALKSEQAEAERAACERWITDQKLCQGSDISLFRLERNGELVSLHALLCEAYQAGQVRAALAQPSPVRSSLLINGYQLRAALEFIAPDGTAKQLESEARIEWRQQDADFLEAGLYAWCAEYPEEGCVLLDEEPATAQPSPASDLDPFNLAPHAEAFNEAPAEVLKPEPAEAERPKVVARVVHLNPVVLDHCGPLNANDELMTVAQHAASVARWAEMFNRVEQERDAALARVAELEKQEPVATIARVPGEDWNGLHFYRDLQGMQPGTKLYAAPVAQAQQLHDLDKQCRDDVARALGLRPSKERGFAWSYLLASIKDAAQAQHSVPEGYALIPTRETEAMHDAVMALLYKGVARTDTQKLLNAYIAAAPGKEGL